MREPHTNHIQWHSRQMVARLWRLSLLNGAVCGRTPGSPAREAFGRRTHGRFTPTWIRVAPQCTLPSGNQYVLTRICRSLKGMQHTELRNISRQERPSSKGSSNDQLFQSFFDLDWHEGVRFRFLFKASPTGYTEILPLVRFVLPHLAYSYRSGRIRIRGEHAGR